MIKKITSSFLAKIIIIFSGVVVSGYLSRSLTENDFGLYALCLSLITFSSLIGSSGMHLSISKHYHTYKNNSNFNEYILYTLFFGICNLSLAFALLKFFNINFFKDINNILFIVFTIGIIFSIIRVLADYFRATDRIKLFLNLNTLSSGGGVFLWASFLVLVMMLNFFDSISLTNVLCVLIISSIFTLALSFYNLNIRFIYLKKILINILNFKFNFEYFKFLKSSLSFMIINILFQMNNFLPIWFIGIFFSPIEAGYFFASKKICSLVLAPLSIIDVVFPSDISKTFLNDKTELQILVKKLSSIRFIVSSLLFILIYFFNREIILIIFGADFIVIENIIKILLLFYLPQFIFGSPHQLLIMTHARKIVIVVDTLLIFSSIFIYYLFLNVLTLELFVLILSIISLIRYFIYFIISYFYIGINTLPNPFKLSIK